MVGKFIPFPCAGYRLNAALVPVGFDADNGTAPPAILRFRSVFFTSYS